LVETGKLSGKVAEKIDPLKPGSFVNHKSWGVGEVRSWDLLGDRLLIDFEGKPEHAMKLQFAANALEPIPEDHILARRFRKVEELQEAAEEDPVGLVAEALSSHGNSMLLDEIDDVFKGAEGRYKSWWDATKKKLRQDQRFVVPSKRNIPMELRPDDIDPADSMAQDVLDASDLKAKAKAVETILKNSSAFTDPPNQLRPVIEDLNEAATKSLRLMLSQALELILCRMDLQACFGDLELGEEELTLAEVLREERESLDDTLRTLTVARQRQILQAFPEAFGDDYTEVVFGMLNNSGMRGIGELTRFLFDEGAEDALLSYLRKGLQQRTLNSDVVAWICKERKGRAAPLMNEELPSVIMANLERDYLGEGARRSNRLSEILQSDPELIPDLVRDVDLNQVRGFVRRLMMSPAFDALSTNSLLARIVKIHPGVQELITGEAQGEEEDHLLIVSWESLEARQKELDHLVNVLQPKNREEIKVAREYGDLRENFEYKAAKQQEAILRRQREEMEKDLQRARGTDFADADTSQGSIGTVVTVEDVATGKTDTFTILGAWDSDPERNVIAYTTGAGRALIGRSEGETTELPTDEPNVTRTVKLVDIAPYKG